MIITLKKGSTSLRVDHIIPTHQGFVIGIKVQPRTTGNIAAVMLEAGSTMIALKSTELTSTDWKWDKSVLGRQNLQYQWKAARVAKG